MCWPAVFRVERGGRYRVELAVTQPWSDGGVPASPLGVEAARMPWEASLGGIPLRRSLGDPWFRPLVKIVPPEGSGEPSRTQALEAWRVDAAGKPGTYAAEFVATAGGELFLAVNDAVLSWRGLSDRFYANNQGEAEVRVERVDGGAAR